MAGTLTEIQVPTGTWHVDRLHSSIGFAVEHMGVSLFRGHFTDYDATLEVGPQGARLDGAARVESVDVADENLEAHLASPEFFDSQRTPDLRFASTDLRVDGEELVLAGELTIRGHTEPLEATGTLRHVAQDIAGAQRVGIVLQATVDRRRFGMDWNAPLAGGGLALGTQVTLDVRLELTPAA
jgi:polyisoprenoid-binding protein YceI